MNDDITRNLKKVVSEKSGCIKCYCICTIYRLINEYAHWYMFELPSNTDSTGYNILIIKIKQDYIYICTSTFHHLLKWPLKNCQQVFHLSCKRHQQFLEEM